MKFEVKVGDLSSAESEAIVINLFEGVEKPSGATAAVDAAMDGAITKLIGLGDIKGKLNEIHVLHSLGKIPARIILIVGLGKKKDLNTNKIRNLMGEMVRTAKAHRCRTLSTIIHGAGLGDIEIANSTQAIVEGCLLGSYKFTKHKTEDEEETDIEYVTLVENDATRLDIIRKYIERGIIYAEAAILARDMINEPANYMTPTDMAQIAHRLAEDYSLDITVLEREQMEKVGMGALLGVAQGSHQSPKFIILSYKGDSSKPDTIGFVGKGLTFDSGGISLKSQEFMSDMKGDMSGGAVVMGTISAIARLKLKMNIVALIPATENLPGGRAVKPGDILKAMNGKTIEVVNTDAEGRLILADALSYAVANGLSPIIDVATLTGACHIALGDLYAGVLTNNQELVERLIKAGSGVGEDLWQLPLPEEYKELNKTDIADIKNSGARYGGAITGALFLQEFVADKPWVHMDIAGPFMSEKTKGILVKGATGFGTRTLINFAEEYSKR